MSQSAASEALLNLEHTYNVSLFDRVSNKLALNAIGHTLRKAAAPQYAPHFLFCPTPKSLPIGSR
jgi:DNA-binding transcriptional LysR family regulator